jgi:SAM-dependent methyltransferase
MAEPGNEVAPPAVPAARVGKTTRRRRGDQSPGSDGPRLPLWPSLPPAHYLGQLDPAFQAAQADRRADLEIRDCLWYHTFDLPDGEVVPGTWDLRGGEDEYLGGTDFAGKRVLEPGPASGYLTFYMERMGAEVVSFETGFDVPIDLLPIEGLDQIDEQNTLMRTTVDQIHNSWWYMHQVLGSRAALVHGDIYNMPGDLGTFDVSIFGALLLHLREPWGALKEAARRTTQRIVVTELIQDDEAPLEANVMRFAPRSGNQLSQWWTLYPGAVVSMLERLGFRQTALILHSQAYHADDHLDGATVKLPMYTVIADRP